MVSNRALHVLIVHGVGRGSDNKTYARPLQRNISFEFERAVARLRLRHVPRSETRAKRALRFQTAYWSPVTQQSQDALLGLLGLGGLWPLRSMNPFYLARKQMVNLLGDVIAYADGPQSAVYAALHGRMTACVEALAQQVEGDDRAELTVIGHDLGGVIASDYVWDNTRGASPPHHLTDYPFSIKNMIMLGTPLAVYALRNKPHAERHELADALDAPVQVSPDGGVWLNMYDPQDLVGFPLRALRGYAAAGVIDMPVRAGGRFAALTPLSQVSYWRSIEVAQAIGRKLALDWAALNVPEFAEAHYDKALKTYHHALR